MLSIILIFLALVILYFILCFFLCRLACRRFSPHHDPLRNLNQGAEKELVNYPELIGAGKAWLEANTPEDVFITSFDGLRLHGALYRNACARAVLVACHGYRSTGTHDFCSALPFYAEEGFHILLMDQRSCGSSEGKYTTFGIRERLDVQDWCTMAGELFPGLPVVAAGISMGAASVLMAADGLPNCVSAIAADCSYVSPWDELAYIVHRFIHLPARPLLTGIDFWCKILGGFSLRQFSTETALAANHLPVLMIHGQSDELVPCSNSEYNYRLCNPDSVLFTVPGAGHGMSFLADNPGYRSTAEDFFSRVLSANDLTDDSEGVLL